MPSLKHIILITSATLLAIFLFEIWQFVSRVNLGRKLAATSVPYEQNNVGDTPRILVVGDSTARGTGARYPEDSVAGRLGNAYPSAYIKNFGTNGLTAHTLRENFPDVSEKSFDIVFVHIGGNDILRFTDLATLTEDTRAIINRAKRVGTHTVILHSGNAGLAPFFPRPVGWLYTARTRRVRAAYIQLAEETGVIYVDLFRERKDDIFSENPQKYYAEDFLHPSGDGYEIWYNEIIAALERHNIQIRI